METSPVPVRLDGWETEGVTSFIREAEMAEQQTESITGNHVMAVIDGSVAAQEAIENLRREGFTEAAHFQGEEMAAKVDAKGENANPLARLIKAAQDHLSEEPNYLGQYQEEARNGREVVAVQVEDREQADAVKTVLERHGARNLRYFTKLAVTDLSPETNPTARSADSPEPQSNV
jgi:hypothetical protein